MQKEEFANSVSEVLERFPHADVCREIANLVRSGKMNDASELARRKFSVEICEKNSLTDIE